MAKIRVKKINDEAREIEKGNDSVLRTPHMKEGNTGHKTDLISKPE